MEAVDFSLLMDQLHSLNQLGLDKSAQLLADMLVFNCSVKNRFLLVSYGDSLYNDDQYNRALHYYRQALTAEAGNQSDSDVKNVSEGRIQWRIYKCYLKLRQYDDAIHALLSVPVKQRTIQIELALAKLYQNFKKDNNNAVMYYRMVLMKCPFALEAVTALLSLGVSLAQLVAIFRQHTPSLSSYNWLSVWLKAQENISLYQYADALRDFETLNKSGFTLSPENNSQIGWIMSKLLKKSQAIELFKKARVQDPYVINYMDTFGRLLSSKSSNPTNSKLADQLLAVSSLHPQPLVVKIWSLLRTQRRPNATHVQILIQKINNITSSLEAGKSEKSYLLGTISLSRQKYEEAIVSYQEAIRIDPSFFEAYESLLRCYLICRGYRAAFSTMSSAVKSIKIPSQQLYLEAIVLASKPGTEAKAIKCLENAVKLDKTFDRATIALCHSLTQSTQTVPKAIEMLKDILKVHQSAPLYYELAKCHEFLKHFVEALENYEISVRMDPDFNDAVSSLLSLQEKMSSGDTLMEFEREGERGGGDENEPAEAKENLSDILFGQVGEGTPAASRDLGGDVSAFPVLDFGEEEEEEGEGDY
ncbi:PREDICTED: anaphase-promoting complex subunit 7-like [Amphimedon queenslandica]|uniref:Anaphase-promoting complex subunit 7 n=1 Tax=Amphimedon queenslandica TaxID=400682 RepID=A0A1X7U703_AMPQE|nr:PREDICTED: anaphase-promoting complex subunit 7-like [Amphimedon queenslandica]|eukprot:XP_019855989.1 PREDICTED: anaphase-promoting complex subunit 7-like [Amphimedon queenslandica]